MRRLQLGLAGLAGLQAYRWLRVATSVQRHELYWKRRALRPGELRYVALGDSLAQGVGAAHPERGYVGLLAARLEAATGAGVEVINLSATGILLTDLVRDQLPVLRGLDPHLVTVTIGTNDAGRHDQDRFAARFDGLCAELPPGTLVADLPKFHHGRRAKAARSAAAEVRRVLAAHPHLVPVPLDRATANTGLAERSADMFHPNDRGYRRYAEVFWAALLPTLPDLVTKWQNDLDPGGPVTSGGRGRD